MSYTIPARDTLIWYAVDLDGTLAEPVWPDPGVGSPIEANVRKVRELVAHGYKIVVHTSRSWEAYETIEGWLRHNSVPFSRVVCGKLLAHRYVDDRNVQISDSSWLPEDAFPALRSTLSDQNASEVDS